jgi:Probable zinc-ribbon domain
MSAYAEGFSDFVAHPRFGQGPRRTGLDPANTPDGSVFLHWHSGAGVRVPHTAIVASVSEQTPATVPVTHYFDAKRVCRACGRQFLFFAEEQKHWYEELKFPLEADCLECVLCRKAEQQLQLAQRKYAALISNTARSDAETLALVEYGVLLIEAAVFSKKALPRLRGFIKPILAAGSGVHHGQAAALRARITAAEAR